MLRHYKHDVTLVGPSSSLPVRILDNPSLGYPSRVSEPVNPGETLLGIN